MSSSAMSSGDFWCKEHSAWNCMCYLPPGSITTSGGGMVRKRDEAVTYFQDHDGSSVFRQTEILLAQTARTEGVLQLGEGNYVTREDDVVTIRREDGKSIVQMEYGTWKRLGGKDL